MMKNNNRKIISKMARHSLLENRGKNLFILTAIVLTSFMVTAVLTLGTSYYQANQKQAMRQYGAKHDAVLMGPAQAQIKLCRGDEEIAYAGITAKCGSVQGYGDDDALYMEFIWCDETFWEKQKKPALEHVIGSYPQKEDELMISEAALESCGEEGLGVGADLDFVYEDKNGTHRKTFTICGIFKDYFRNEVAYVSEAFLKKSGARIDDVMAGRMYLEFTDWIWFDGQRQAFEARLQLQKAQRLYVTNNAAEQLKVFAGMVGIVLITLCSGYLLIYNILYLSVNSHVRYYGLLATIGMTERQIRSFIIRQMSCLGGVGMTAGMLLGGAASMWALPGLLRGLGIQSEAVTEVCFQPWIYLLAALLIGITIYTGSRKPARIAGGISPIEASRFAAGKSGRKSQRTRKGCPVLTIACRNLQKEKKKTAVVILSMGLCASLFLCVMTLIQSQEARTMIPIYADADLAIVNETFLKTDRSAYKQIFDVRFMNELAKIEGIENVDVTYGEDIIVPWAEGFPDEYMKEFYETWMTFPYHEEDYRDNPDEFYSVMIGINEGEFEKLNAGLSDPVDPQSFYDGEYCLIFRSWLDLTDDYLIGQRLRFYPRKEGREAVREVEVAAVTDGVELLGGHSGSGPNIVVSSNFLNKIMSDAKIQRLIIHYKESYDEKTEQQIKELVQNSPCTANVRIYSQIEVREDVRKSQGNLMIFGIGIAILVGFIGVMNYINTIISNVRNRLVELSVLESIGMTAGQARKMLAWEGTLYFGLTVLFTASVGTGAVYLIFQSMNEMNVPFTVPAAPIIISILLVCAICIGVPMAAYRFMVKDRSVIERIREL